MVAYDGGGLGGGYSTPKFGLWPVCNSPPRCDNGWGPQNISLTAHTAALTSAVEKMIENPDQTGIVALDYEGWQANWDDLLGNQYKTASEDSVRLQHPDWPAVNITAEAQRQFNAAARAFYTATFQTLKKLRPKISWTHHAYPVMICYNTATARAHNDDMLWMYEMLDVVMPSIYLQPLGSYPGCNTNESTLLRNTLREAGRMAEAVGKSLGRRPTPVVPLTWPRKEIPGDNAVLNASWFDVEMFTPFEFPYTAGVQVCCSLAVLSLTLNTIPGKLRTLFESSILPCVSCEIFYDWL